MVMRTRRRTRNDPLGLAQHTLAQRVRLDDVDARAEAEDDEERLVLVLEAGLERRPSLVVGRALLAPGEAPAAHPGGGARREAQRGGEMAAVLAEVVGGGFPMRGQIEVRGTLGRRLQNESLLDARYAIRAEALGRSRDEVPGAPFRHEAERIDDALDRLDVFAGTAVGH